MSTDDLLTQALSAHQRRKIEREQAQLAHEHEQKALAQAFVTHHSEGWSTFVGNKLLGAASDPAAQLTWWVFGQSLSEYTMAGGTPPRFEQNRGRKPEPFRVGAYIADDTVLSLQVDPNGVVRGLFVHTDGHEPQRVDNLADLGEEVTRMRAGV
ncbi:hypothetical protein [Curtobacterium sp. MCLR17_054]|uniref:hypothetical protein n=1 Tax=Curtobacterium sp. MCLR17_054 TaxID=2175632 RepID=UPI000DA90404|nr:hypothetical protein [Curtobacterium sp. MCLR17_054]WIE70360.1 hypothetical protein DEJ08_018770 [Curtobacterium sp. MCLR17_054]